MKNVYNVKSFSREPVIQSVSKRSWSQRGRVGKSDRKVVKKFWRRYYYIHFEQKGKLIVMGTILKPNAHRARYYEVDGGILETIYGLLNVCSLLFCLIQKFKFFSLLRYLPAYLAFDLFFAFLSIFFVVVVVLYVQWLLFHSLRHT